MNKLERVHLNYEAVSGLDYEQLLKEGTKFRSHYDDDPWYIVKIVKDGDTVLVIYKSWSRYGKGYIYKVSEVNIFLYELSLDGQLYKDKNGNYIIKDTKKN